MIGLMPEPCQPGALPCVRSLAYSIAFWVAASQIATPCMPTARRALFIMVNMQARPLFSSPISQPKAPFSSPNFPSPKIIVQVGEP
ncbi:hypothetical protein D3C72_1547580 [compost metagenome]